YRADAPSPYGWLEKLAWSRDGKRLAFTVIFDGYPAEIIVAEWAGDGPTLFKLPRPEGGALRGDGPPPQWGARPAGLYVPAAQEAGGRLCRAAGVGPGRLPEFSVLTPGDVVVESLSLGETGDQAAVILNDPKSFPDVYLVAREGTRRLTNV